VDGGGEPRGGHQAADRVARHAREHHRTQDRERHGDAHGETDVLDPAVPRVEQLTDDHGGHRDDRG
jgi:hypothetical protein